MSTMKKPNINYQEIFRSKTNNFYIQFFRYFFVGGFAFIIDFGLLFVFTSLLGVNYLISAAIGFSAGLIVNYILSRVWVFSKSQYNNTTAFLLFTLIGVAGLGLNEIIMFVCTGVFGLWYMFSKVISTGIVFVFNFVTRKLLVF